MESFKKLLFLTTKGYFGLVFEEKFETDAKSEVESNDGKWKLLKLLKTYLPYPSEKKLIVKMNDDFPESKYPWVILDQSAVSISTQEIVEKIKNYFEGIPVEFFDEAARFHCDHSNKKNYGQVVYKAVEQIRYGAKKTYNEVANAVSVPNGQRMVGHWMKKNSLPLIIPCHRVVGTKGLGGFSAKGGIIMKKWMLHLESTGELS